MAGLTVAGSCICTLPADKRRDDRFSEGGVSREFLLGRCPALGGFLTMELK
jgi:hypothetical protein